MKNMKEILGYEGKDENGDNHVLRTWCAENEVLSRGRVWYFWGEKDAKFQESESV